ncbi:hypothetical protein DMUE_3713 [Dictyocoela muelleri]|nr:hypothetical protein DMUE_3713 [Dictyocoela muelleri]
MQNINYIKSQRGELLLVYENFIYNKCRLTKRGQGWRCVSRPCMGRVFMKDGVIMIGELHTHADDLDKIMLLKIKSLLYESAEKTDMSFENSLLDATQKYSIETIGSICNIYSLRDEFTKIRRRKDFPGTKNDDDILHIYKLTYENELFIQHDCRKNSDDRIIMFYTHYNVEVMRRSNVFLVDGTFKAATNNFTQLFVIHVMYFDKRLPMVYVLTKSKTIETYKKIFSHLKVKEKIEIPHLISDYEIAIINSFKSIYNFSKVSGCLFHFGQIMWRKIQKNGYTNDYKSNNDFRRFINYLLLLSYVPPEKVPYYFNIISTKFSNDIRNHELLDYFKNNFIENQKNQNNKNISFWSVYDRCLSRIPTTTCSLEAWHRFLNSKIGKGPSTLGKLVNILKNEERKTKITIESLKSGKISVKKNEKIELTRILTNFHHYEPFEYLDTLYKIINFYLN